MYRRILVPIDGSDCSRAALDHALKLAHEQQAEVRIVHVLDTRSLYAFENMNVEPIETAWHQAGQDLLDRAEEQARGAGVAVSASLIGAKGQRVAGVIVGECADWQADLVVMGTHGRHGIERALLGSVAEGVVRASRVPVLLILKQ